MIPGVRDVAVAVARAAEVGEKVGEEEVEEEEVEVEEEEVYADSAAVAAGVAAAAVAFPCLHHRLAAPQRLPVRRRQLWGFQFAGGEVKRASG